MIIKIHLSNNKSISLPYEKVKEILENPLQLVMIMDDKKWTGQTINKAHIVSTTVDEEASKMENMSDFLQPQLNPEDEKDRLSSIKNTLMEKREELKKRGIII